MAVAEEDPRSSEFPPIRSHTSSSSNGNSHFGNGSTLQDHSPAAKIQVLSAAKVLHGQSRELSGVSLRGFLLGVSLGISLLVTGYLASKQMLLWRLPFFTGVLSLFHFLEFYMTAVYNTQYADISAFLLSQNGKAYNIAHSMALLECLVRVLAFPQYQMTSATAVSAGFVAILAGQATRSIAMAQASTNFNHTVQTQRQKGHELVTHGIYRWLRHPAYFGFFWWGLGTQLVLGNPICFTAYTIVLWSFFRTRIQKEEEYLISFFGDDYASYREATPVWVPFIK